MEKNWLIRTKSNHILGPVSKEKVLELYRNGTIKPDDEICSGNGFWFYLRETELVDKYLLGDAVQSFNPISEAKDVLTASEALPESRDEDITMIGQINTSALNEIPEAPVHEDVSGEALGTTPKKKTRIQSTVKKLKPTAQTFNKQNYFRYIGIFCFILLFLLIYFRKTIIRSLFEGEVTLVSFVLNSAHAQEEPGAKKKSSLNAVSSSVK